MISGYPAIIELTWLTEKMTISNHLSILEININDKKKYRKKKIVTKRKS